MFKSRNIELDEVVRYFHELEDPRSEINRRHPLVSVVVIAVMAVLAGSGGPTAIAKWVQVQSADTRADGQATDRRQAIASVPAVEHRALATRRPCPTNRWRQHVSGFIEKNQVRIALTSRGSDVWKANPFEEFDVDLVLFTRPALRLLRRPVQAFPQKPADMIVMELDAKMPFNQYPDAGTGPQLIRPAVGLGALAQQFLQTTMLFGRQAWRWAVMRFGSQAVRLSSHVKPAKDRAAIDANDPSHDLRALTLDNGLHRLTPPPLQFRGRSKWSTHKGLDAPTMKPIHWPRS